MFENYKKFKSQKYKANDVEVEKEYIARLYVCFSYLYAVSENFEIKNKDEFRQEALKIFEQGKSNKINDFYIRAWKAVDFLVSDKGDITDLEIRVLKGGAYKIKKYYLENDKLKDIRGASNLLAYVQEDYIPQKIASQYIEECIIYCGGGNIFAVLPKESNDKDIAIELEKEAAKYPVSAPVAYYTEKVRLSDVIGKNYKEKMGLVENNLAERKKSKLYNEINNISQFEKQTIYISSDKTSENAVKIDFEDKTGGKNLCSRCLVKKSYYQIKNAEQEKENVCASCLHKIRVGEVLKSRYLKYIKDTGVKVNSLKDIKDEAGNVAILYGDGNNMGGVIAGFKKIYEMMQFSDVVKDATTSAVFDSMNELCVKKVEIVGLGGDDIFIIVEGDKSIRLGVEIIKKYKEKFKKYYSDVYSTMSVGISIAKYSEPIKIMLEVAEDELKKAKKVSKQNSESNKDNGSISFKILTGFERKTEKNKNNTLLPYSVETAEKILEFAYKLKKSNISITRLQNLSEAYKNAESEEEADLFFDYMNAKTKEKIEELIDIDGYIKNKTFYKKEKENTSYYIWDDIIDILAYTEERKN